MYIASRTLTITLDAMDLRQARTLALHIVLFVATFFTTTIAGVQWLNRDPLELANFSAGLSYSIPLLIFLSCHEFGHFFAARFHGVSATLPFFIPVPPFLVNPFGTMGAVIRVRSPFPSRRALFDIGIAGPVAGFVVTVIFLLVGFWTLPGKEHLYMIHPEYALDGIIPEHGFAFGGSILFWSLRKLFAFHAYIPPMSEIYHYPLLCVGWFGLFVTALNLLPVGQLDGGHILYALVGGKAQGRIGRLFFGLLILVGLTGVLPFLGFSSQLGTLGWLLWGAILYFVIKLDHPPLPFDDSLTPGRRMLGWAGVIIFLISFPPVPFYE